MRTLRLAITAAQIVHAMHAMPAAAGTLADGRDVQAQVIVPQALVVPRDMASALHGCGVSVGPDWREIPAPSRVRYAPTRLRCTKVRVRV